MKKGAGMCAAVLAALLATGCGGGGGGSGGGGTSNGGGGAPTTPVDPDAPTFQFGARHVDAKSGALVMDAIANGSSVLNFAQFTTDVAHRFASAGSPPSVSANCAYTGQVTLQFDDKDGNGRASAGDVITVNMANCGVPVFARSLTGNLRVDILATTPSADIDLQARVTILDSLTIAALVGWPNIGPILTSHWSGSLNVQWSESSTGAQLRASSTASDDVRIKTTSGSGTEYNDALRKIDVSRAVHYDSATVGGSIAFLYDVGGNGLASVRTTAPFVGDLNVLSRQFTVEATIGGGQVMRAQRIQSAVGVPTVSTVLLVGGVPQADTTASPGWGEALTFMKDVRSVAEVYQAGDQGSGLSGFWPWRDAPISSADGVFEQRTTGGISSYRADALFKRPVAGQPGMTEANAVARLQFGRAIADGTPDLRFRLADAAEVVEAASPTWNVPVTAVRRGASYEIRPAEALRRGRSYKLQVSTDGVTWVDDFVFRDAQNQVVHQGPLTGVSTDNVFVAKTTYSERAVLSAITPARLRGAVTAPDGQAVSGSYQWVQISGVPLRLATPQAAETDVVLDTASQAIGDAVVQLTFTDSLGRTDRVRLALKAGSYATQGAAYYTDTGNSLGTPRREVTTGAGSFVYGPEPGRLSSRVLTDGGGGSLSFSITPANGQRLAVGMYADAVQELGAAGSQNALWSNVFCNTDGALVTGSFEVLDVAYADDGSISRLAVDYSQRCEDRLQEYARGSYRYNSAVPLTP